MLLAVPLEDRTQSSNFILRPIFFESMAEHRLNAEEVLLQVPEHLRIRILFVDDHVIVIDKPCNLRSVPGNAHIERAVSQNELASRKRSRNDSHTGMRLTAQEAWIKSIKSFRVSNGLGDSDDAQQVTPKHNVDRYLALLGGSDTCVVSIPRKFPSFHRYLLRNRQRIMMSTCDSDEEITQIAHEMFSRIAERKCDLMNLPEPTADHESALGQLKLIFTSENRSRTTERPSIHVVHRLDCETSGVMVFARTSFAASKLCQHWRLRDKVSKVYLAQVHDWPSFQEEKETSGCIDLPLAADNDAKIKWKVCFDTGKESRTSWRVLDTDGKDGSSPIILELTPVTGRTHQLRIHCAALSSGIVGDSLYGRSAEATTSALANPSSRLMLHAYKLSFPHPYSEEPVEFMCPPYWDAAA